MLLVQFAFVVLLELVLLGKIVARHKCLIPGAECKGLRALSTERRNE